jgi:uncharacterized protein
MPYRSEAFFAAARPRNDPHPQRFGMWHVPAGPASQAPPALLVHVHAFTEEMNKARRMVAMQAHALAAHGHAVLQLDLLGCGDSPGDFADATWSAWLADVHTACELALQRFAQQWPQAATPQLWLWGLRTGCLLANAAADQRPAGRVWNQLFWQPQTAGKAVLQQFLRLKLASGLQVGGARAEASDPRQDWAAGRVSEIAGYCVSAPLAHGLERATLVAPPASSQVIWLETSTREPAALLPASELAIGRWQQAGVLVHSQAVQGPAFWQTTEIEDAPALITATLQALQGLRVGSGAAP